MLENQVYFNFNDIKNIFSSEVIHNFQNNWNCKGVSIDSRNLKRGNLFIAIKGENNDGHNYIQSSLENGASAIIANQDWFLNNQSFISDYPHVIVKNTYQALGLLANYHRRRFNIPIIAIAGSNGKTTTKEMAAHLLSQKYNVLKTYRNYNNQIGLPLMLFQLDNSYDIGVFELGTNEPGEMATLTKISEPNFGLITNIGKEHLEKLIDIDGVEFEETLLYGWLHKTGGLAFINMEDERLNKYYHILENKFSYSLSLQTNLIANIEIDEQLKPTLNLIYKERNITAQLQTYGYASALNATAASAISLYFELSDEEISTGLETYTPEKWHGYGRMFIEKRKYLTIINDCYNANPSSMEIALNSIKNYNFNGEKIAVLGDMKELGDCSFEEHKKILEQAIKCVDKILLYGDEMKRALKEFEDYQNIKHFETHKDIAEELSKVKEETLMLLKGSRGMKMEEILNVL